MNKCPVCGGDRNTNMADVKDLCKKHELNVELCNPGGREFFFKNKGRLQVGDMCNACDEKKIMEFLET